MSFRSDSISRIARSTRGNSWSGLNCVLVVILVIMLMQNPFALSTFVFGDWYYWIYLAALFFFIIIGSFARGRYNSVIYSTKYLQYYCAFVFLSLVCIILNTAARLDIELFATARFIGRLIQFYVIYNVLRILGVSFVLRLMYRLAVVFSLLTIVFSLLNLLGMSNIFFNSGTIADDITMHYSFPYGFTTYLIPHSGPLQMSSYFTEPVNYAYYLILFLIYACYKFTKSRQVGYLISAVLILTSIHLCKTVGGYATVVILIAFVITRTKLSSISIKNSLFLLLFLILFIWSGYLIVTFFLSGEIEHWFLLRRAFSIELRFQEWMFSVHEIIRTPLGFGIGNVSPVADALNSERLLGYGRGYGGPTNFLAPIYSLGIPYLVPFMFYGVVLLWCLRIKLGASSDLKMVSVMVAGGIILSGSYYQLNTAVFHVTLASLFLLLSEEGKKKVIVPNSLGTEQSRQ